MKKLIGACLVATVCFYTTDTDGMNAHIAGMSRSEASATPTAALAQHEPDRRTGSRRQTGKQLGVWRSFRKHSRNVHLAARQTLLGSSIEESDGSSLERKINSGSLDTPKDRHKKEDCRAEKRKN
ncbi:hypothetical protein FACS1894126_1730 [Alphaproteobacteria bacterium]|nr:hypothetical protein FACS1894126_1730 [Alphaproteobacteria bacterium]